MGADHLECAGASSISRLAEPTEDLTLADPLDRAVQRDQADRR
jgi:hypothetical protein